MADRRWPRDRYQVQLDYAFDRLLDSKLQQLYERLVPDQVPAEWVFEDEGYSGASLVRPGLERLRDLAAEGQIEAVLVHASDRLSRKYAYQVLLIEELGRHGVETIFIKVPQGATAEDQLLVQFQGMIAEYERAQFLERSRRGKRHRAHQGQINVLSGAPYGYRYVRKCDDAAARYEILDAEAAIVRMVYQSYVGSGMSLARSRASSMSAVFRRASKSRAGSAPRFVRCCAILPTRGRRAWGKPRPHRVNASLDRSGYAVALAHATALTTSARVPTGLKLPFPRSLWTIPSCEPKRCLSKTRRLRHVGRSNPASSRGWYRAGNAATRCRVHRPGRALVKSTITDAWGRRLAASWRTSMR